MEPEYAAALREAHAQLTRDLAGAKFSLEHAIPDLVLRGYVTDTLEHSAAVQQLATSPHPRSAYANARAAFEAMQDALLLVASPSEFDWHGSLARAAELVEVENLWKRRAVADAALKLDPVAPQDSPEDIAAKDDAEWSQYNPAVGGMLLRALVEVRGNGARRRHWSGFGRRELAEEIERRLPEMEGYAVMQDAMYGLLSIHAHPRPRSTQQSLSLARDGVLDISTKPVDTDFLIAMTHQAVSTAIVALKVRREKIGR